MSYGNRPAADPSALVTERQAYDRISHMTGDINVRADSDAWTRTSASNRPHWYRSGAIAVARQTLPGVSLEYKIKRGDSTARSRRASRRGHRLNPSLTRVGCGVAVHITENEREQGE